MTKEEYIILKAKYPNASDEEILDIAFTAAFDWLIDNGYGNKTDMLRAYSSKEELKKNLDKD